jgi:hypothetical protein
MIMMLERIPEEWNAASELEVNEGIGVVVGGSSKGSLFFIVERRALAKCSLEVNRAGRVTNHWLWKLGKVPFSFSFNLLLLAVLLQPQIFLLHHTILRLVVRFFLN